MTVVDSKSVTCPSCVWLTKLHTEAEAARAAAVEEWKTALARAEAAERERDVFRRDAVLNSRVVEALDQRVATLQRSADDPKRRVEDRCIFLERARDLKVHLDAARAEVSRG